MFEPNSRYAKVATYQVPDRHGRKTAVVPPAPPLRQALLGYHIVKDGQRLDLLAGRYLADGTAFWRLCELSDVMLPEALSRAEQIPIPRRRS